MHGANKTWPRSLLGIVATTLLLGCGGTMQGTVLGDGTPLQFQYGHGMNRNSYTATLGDESFSGQAVDANTRHGFETVFETEGFSNVYTSTWGLEFVAVLHGDRGSNMRCELSYADSSGSSPLGTVGVCRHSDGRIIDVAR